MAFRRAWIPALAAVLTLLALVWWVCTPAVAEAIRAGTTGTGLRGGLAGWLDAWAHEPVEAQGSAAAGPAGDPSDAGWRETGQRIRIGSAVLVLAAGGLWTARVLPPNSRRRMTASLLVCWSWALIAGVLATAVSAPWLVEAGGRGHDRPAWAAADQIAEGLPVIAAFGLAAAFVFVVTGVVSATSTSTARESTAPPEDGAARERGDAEPPTAARPARLAATVGASLLAVGLLLGNGARAQRAIQEIDFGAGRLAEANHLLMRCLFLDPWPWPGGTPGLDWLTVRAGSVLLIPLFWLSLRYAVSLPARRTVTSVTLLGMCVLVPLAALTGALTSALTISAAPAVVLDSFGVRIPAAMTFGLVAGLGAGVAARIVGGGPAPRTPARLRGVEIEDAEDAEAPAVEVAAADVDAAKPPDGATA